MKDKDTQLIYETYLTENDMLVVAQQWMSMLQQDAEQGYPREDTVKLANELMDKYGVDKETMVEKMYEIGDYDGATISDIVGLEVNDHGDVLTHDEYGAEEGEPGWDEEQSGRDRPDARM